MAAGRAWCATCTSRCARTVSSRVFSRARCAHPPGSRVHCTGSPSAPFCGLSAITRFVGFQARPAESWLRDVLRAEGDLCAGDVLALNALQSLAASVGEPAPRLAAKRHSQLLTWR